MLLRGMTAVVTGAGSGLGMATSELFASEGAQVVLMGRRQSPLDNVAARIRDTGGTALPLAGDVGDPSSVMQVISLAAGQLSGFDILVNNAVCHPKWNYTHRMSINHLDECVAVNLRGPFVLIQAVLPSMLQRRGGSIINVSSILGSRGMKYAAAYCATKAAIVNLTRVVALEYADFGIRANVVCPGAIRPVGERHYTNEERAFMTAARGPALPLEGPTADNVRAALHDPHEYMGGAATSPWDMAQTLLYLAGPDSKHVNGAIINADRGASAG
jgi:NAD(P)-dependent dehydrogenase (short-subunit alcohol dehydrogenase family)